MPVTINHQLSATTPDDTNYEVRPSHWNQSHVASLAVAGLEVIGAFSNANGVSFGTNAQSKVTASVVAQTIGVYGSSQTTGQSSSSTVDARSLSIVGAGGVSVGLSGGSVIVSGATGGAGGGAALSAGTQSVGSGTVAFANSNGVTFGMSGSSQITASVAAQSVQTQNLHNVTLAGNTSGTLAQVSSGTLTLAGGNNITLSQNGNAITISGANAGGAQTGISGVVVSNTTYTSGTVSFSNANGISFGSSAGQAITASYTVPTQTNQSIGIYGSSQTTGQSSSTTVDARSLTLVGQGAISIGASGGSILISSPGTTGVTMLSAGLSNVGNTSGNTGTVTGQLILAGGNNVTLSGSTNGSSMTVTVSAANQTNQTMGLYAVGNTTAQSSSTTVDARSLSFDGANGVSVGMSGGSVVISGATGGAGGGINAAAGTQTGTSGTMVFANSNGVTFGMSGSSQITASVTVTQVSSIGLYALGNTTQNSSTTLDQRTLSFNALGAMTMGYSNGSIQVSAPATSSLSATGGLSISTNGSTISIGQGALTRTIFPSGNLTQISAPGNASMSFQYFPADNPLTATRMDALVAWTAGSSATTNTCAVALSVYGAIYTKNGASLSSLSSGSTQTTYSYASNSAGRTELQAGAIRPISVPINVSMTPGEYYVGLNMVTATSSIGASTTNCGQTFSIVGGNQIQSGLNYNEIGSATNASVGLFGAMGVYSAASTGLPAALSISGIVQTGASLSQANFGFVLRNA